MSLRAIARFYLGLVLQSKIGDLLQQNEDNCCRGLFDLWEIPSPSASKEKRWRIQSGSEVGADGAVGIPQEMMDAVFDDCANNRPYWQKALFSTRVLLPDML